MCQFVEPLLSHMFDLGSLMESWILNFFIMFSPICLHTYYITEIKLISKICPYFKSMDSKTLSSLTPSQLPYIHLSKWCRNCRYSPGTPKHKASLYKMYQCYTMVGIPRCRIWFTREWTFFCHAFHRTMQYFAFVFNNNCRLHD